MSKTHLGHTARKRFGQNFLHDDYVIGKIVAAIAPKNEQNLVEIGPGLGALTDPVCEEVERASPACLPMTTPLPIAVDAFAASDPIITL